MPEKQERIVRRLLGAISDIALFPMYWRTSGKLIIADGGNLREVIQAWNRIKKEALDETIDILKEEKPAE